MFQKGKGTLPHFEKPLKQAGIIFYFIGTLKIGD